MNIQQLDEILSEIDYYNSFKENFLNKSFSPIDYGKRIGKIKFNSFFEAFEKYTFSNYSDNDIIKSWNKKLNDSNTTEEDLLIVCLEIFDWGNVLNGNITKAIKLYKQNKLKAYINWITPILLKKEVIKSNSPYSDEFEIIWTSGWTKVYSFLNTDLLIYDSRVSAFLNYTLIQNYDELNNSQKNTFNILSQKLYNFNGAQGRERQVNKSLGFKNQHPKGENGLNANLISSWIVQLLNEKLNLNLNIRDYERAFFMLGFDLKQIK